MFHLSWEESDKLPCQGKHTHNIEKVVKEKLHLERHLSWKVKTSSELPCN